MCFLMILGDPYERTAHPQLKAAVLEIKSVS